MDDERRRQRFERVTDPVRVLALSDGVFAIVITLLVLEIHVPELTGGQDLREALQEVRPSFVAFLISFIVVAIAWAGPRDQFALIGRTDRMLIWLNILYLLPLSILPFGASLLTRYDQDPTALELYGLLLLAIAATRLIMWMYATGRPHLLYVPIDARSRWAGVAAVVVPGVAYGIGYLVAASYPTASLTIYATVPLLYFIVITLARTTAPPESAERDFT
jgi:uncharacterized membrane protein